MTTLENQFINLKVSNKGASGFVASKGDCLSSVGYTAVFPVHFMQPPLVKDTLLSASLESLEGAEYALSQGSTLQLVFETSIC